MEIIYPKVSFLNFQRPIEIKITWEGEAPGIAQHRLSLGAFGPALSKLVLAYRRIASNMMRRATSYAETGRFQDLANRLDIEIETINGNSLQVNGLVTFAPPPELQATLFPFDIPERASKELLDFIEAESKGRPYNTGVRNFLSAFPPGLTKQKYELNENGRVLHEPVVIDHLELADPSLPNLPHFVMFSGSIVGVGFPPGTSEVRVRTTEGESLRFLAQPELVNRALDLRGRRVGGLAVKSKDSRLLRLKPVSENGSIRLFTVTESGREEYVFNRWDTLLRRLA